MAATLLRGATNYTERQGFSALTLAHGRSNEPGLTALLDRVNDARTGGCRGAEGV